MIYPFIRILLESNYTLSIANILNMEINASWSKTIELKVSHFLIGVHTWIALQFKSSGFDSLFNIMMFQGNYYPAFNTNRNNY